MELKEARTDDLPIDAPEDWRIADLQSLSAFITKGSTPTTFGFSWTSTGIQFLRSECVSEAGLDLTQSMFISEKAHQVLKRSEVEGEDILLTITGNVGRVIHLGKHFPKSNINQHIARIRIKDGKTNKAFVYQYLRQEAYRKHFNAIVTGQAYPQISLLQVREAKIAVPPTTAEQTAIATTLSDTDSLITSLEKLIAKKRNIKHGAMQELLKPKRGWNIEELGRLASIETGSKNTQDKVQDGLYPFFVRSQTVERINSYSFDGEAILTAGDGVGTGKVFHYINGKFDFHQRVYKLSDFRGDINGYYLFIYFSNNFYNRIMQMTAKSSVDSVRMEMIAKMPIPFPTLEKQIAIATILTDMETDIKSLEAKLAKYRSLKIAMMQSLLTGKIRLI